MDDVVLDHQVIIQEFAAKGIVGEDAADLGSSQEDVFGLFLFKETHDSCLVPQVKFTGTAQDELIMPGLLQLSEDGGTHHAPVSCNIDPAVFFHVLMNTE